VNRQGLSEPPLFMFYANSLSPGSAYADWEPSTEIRSLVQSEIRPKRSDLSDAPLRSIAFRARSHGEASFGQRTIEIISGFWNPRNELCPPLTVSGSERGFLLRAPPRYSQIAIL